MDSSHMKSFKNMLLEVAQEMEEPNVRTKKSYQETKNQESVIEDFVVTNIKTYTVHINTTFTITALRSTKVLKIMTYVNRL